MEREATPHAVYGVKAKTVYPARPAEWPDSKEWPPDIAFTLLQAGLLQGKSIGLLPTKIHFPSQTEIDRFDWKSAKLVIDEWLLLEYACTALPMQQNALVEAISKSRLQLPEEFLEILGWKGAWPGSDVGREAWGVEREASSGSGEATPHAARSTPHDDFSLSRFTPLEEIEKAFTRQIAALDIKSFADQAAREALDRLRGRV